MLDDCFRLDKHRLRHADALEILKSRLSPVTGRMSVELNEASGRILAASIAAPRDIPMFDNSAVDGYAYAMAGHEQAGGYFRVAARIAAGDKNPAEIPTSGAARIFTGAPMPQGTDSVAMQEDCGVHEQDGGKFVVIPQGQIIGANVRKSGEDVSAGEIVAEPATLLRPQDIAAIASCGINTVEVFKPLKIALASTGNEIIRPGEKPNTASVYDANSAMLHALLANLPVEITDLGILRDDRPSVEATLLKAAKTHDIILTSGGASMGSQDHITKLLDEKGKRHLWQLAIKPGRPMCFGQLSDAMFFGLPGNPVAGFVCFLLYLRPAILALGGMSGKNWQEPRRYKIASAIAVTSKKPDRREFWRGYLAKDDEGNTVLKKFERDGSGLISGLRQAEGFIEIAEDVTRIAPGDMLEFIPFSEFGIV